MEEKHVVIYSTPTCHFCHQAKDFFKEHNIQFIEHDVSADADKRKEMVQKSDQMGVPVIVVGDETVIGFDQGKLAEILGIEA